MTTAAEDLAEGLAQLDAELGESYVRASTAAAFTARLERNRPRQIDNFGGTTLETVLHVQRDQDAFEDGLPEVGETITRPGGGATRLARVDPGELPSLVIFILGDDVS